MKHFFLLIVMMGTNPRSSDTSPNPITNVRIRIYRAPGVFTPHLTMRACRGVLPRESGSLMRSLSPWSISSLRVCSVSSADFLPCSSSTCRAVISCYQGGKAIFRPGTRKKQGCGSDPDPGGDNLQIKTVMSGK